MVKNQSSVAGGSEKAEIGEVVLSGEVLEALPAGTFKVVLDDSDHHILGRLSGKMRVHRIKILPGDKVKVQISPYDLTKGLIVYRF